MLRAPVSLNLHKRTGRGVATRLYYLSCSRRRLGIMVEILSLVWLVGCRRLQGSNKTWYAVPGGEGADRMEAAMKEQYPDLFKKCPDLMLQLVTQVTITQRK
jgi:hypothetical protein